MSVRKNRKALLGLGLDNKDGHLRLTKGENYLLLSGSEETHGMMQEKAIRFNEELKRRDKTLDNICREEFVDIAESINMKPRRGQGGQD